MSLHRVYVDGETFSECDLPVRGLGNYWDHPSTGTHCLAYKFGDGPIKLWRAQTAEGVADEFPYELTNRIYKGDLIVAHKAEFEYYLLHRFSECDDYKPRLDQMRCTMAKAAAMAFPLQLGKLSLALGFKLGKDTAGMRAMKILCKPNPATGKMWVYKDAPNLFEDLYRYCIHDVQLEYDIDQMLPDLTEEEQAVWVLNQQVNRRGIGVDRRAAAAAYEICMAESERLNREIRQASGGKIDATTATLQIARFCGMDSVAKDILEVALDEGSVEGVELSDAQRTVLMIRQEAAKSSVLKIKPLLELCSGDGRLRWSQQYHGAATGREAGRGFQPLNIPRGTLHLDAETQNHILDTGLFQTAANAHKTTALKLVSDLLRGLLIASEGYELSSYDYAGIEMVLGAWYVGDEGLLTEFHGERKVYEMTYATAFHIDKASVTKDQRQVGKGMALGYQFGGGADAGITTAWSQLRLKFDPDPEKAKEIAEDLKVRWREARPRYPLYWKALEWAAKHAVMNPGVAYSPLSCPKLAGLTGFQNVSYLVPLVADGTPAAVLQCTLPSMRVLSYPYPKIERHTVVKKDGDSWETDSLCYMVTENNQWRKTHSYGGKLFENNVQAAAADLLRFGTGNMNDAGIPIVLTVYDEVLTETKTGSMPWDSGREIMERIPWWCPGLPIKVTGWQGKRYRKE